MCETMKKLRKEVKLASSCPSLATTVLFRGIFANPHLGEERSRHSKMGVKAKHGLVLRFRQRPHYISRYFIIYQYL